MRKSHYISSGKPWITKVKVNGRIVSAPTETDNYCIYDDKVIFVLSGQSIDERNIWCYRDDGKLLWKIEESPHWLEWLAKQSEEERQRVLARGHKDYYRCIAYKKNEETGEEWLLVRATTGFYDLDPDTGKVSNFEYDGGRG